MIDLEQINEGPIDPANPYVQVLKKEPSRFDGNFGPFEALVVGAAQLGSSDIRIQTDSRVRLKFHGRQHFGTARALTASEVLAILSHMWHSEDAYSILRQGRPLDFSYEVRVDRHRRQRYRVNAKGVMKGTGDGISMTMRPLPTKTPTMDDVALESEIRPYLHPRKGVVVVAGATGQGKSTTLAAVTRYHLENTEEPKAIVDLQAPIEFTYADVLTDFSDCASSIEQSEIGEGRNLPTFAAGVWAALRCAPDIISLGEARDKASLEGCLQASLTGHLVYTTTHAGTVAEGLRRMVVDFPAEERDARAFDLITSLQFFMVQHLIRTNDHRGRVPLREYLLFDDDVRDRFVSTKIDDWPALIAGIMKDSGDRIPARSMAQSALLQVEKGAVTREEARSFLPRAVFE